MTTSTQVLPSFRTGKARVEFGHVQATPESNLPYGIIEGDRPGPCLLVTAGVHASEYCSIETAIRLLKTRPEDIRGSLVVFPILNVEGFRRRSIYVMPQDGKNLNRMFPGSPEGSASERLANWLTTTVFPKVDAYMDLHGGDLDESLTPFTIYPNTCEKSKAMANAFGIPIAIASAMVGTTVISAAKLGVPSILPEVSGNGLWGEETVSQMMQGVRRVMHHLGMTEASEPPAPEPRHVTMWVPTASADGLWYPAKGLNDDVALGDVLGEIRSVFGEVLQTVRSEKAGFVLYQLSSLAVNRSEALLGVGTPLAG